MLPITLLLWIILELAIYLAIGRLLVGSDWLAALTGAIVAAVTAANLNAITWLFSRSTARQARNRFLACWASSSVNILLT